MRNLHKILSLSIVGVFVFLFLPLSSLAGEGVSAEERCSRHEGTDRHDRCIERVTRRIESKAKHWGSMPAEVKEFKATIEAACGEHPGKDTSQEEKQSYKACAKAKSQELKDAGGFVTGKHGKGRWGKSFSFGKHGLSQSQGFGFKGGHKFGQNLPEDVQAQIQSLMEQIRTLMEQNQQ